MLVVSGNSLAGVAPAQPAPRSKVATPMTAPVEPPGWPRRVLRTLLAIPLAFVNPRASRSTNLVFALLTYMVYSNLISVSQAWVSQGKVSFHIGWWAVHLVMLLLLLAMFYRRMRVRSALRRGL